MTRLVLLLCICLWAVLGTAQSVQRFSKVYDINALNNSGRNVIERDNGYTMFGMTWDAVQNSQFSYWNISKNGEVLSSKSYPLDTGYYVVSYQSYVIINSDTFIYLPSILAPSKGSSMNDVLLIKSRVNGDTIWTKRFDFGMHDIAPYINFIPPNTFILSGQQQMSSSNNDMLIMAVDTSGSLLWKRNYGLFANDDAYQSLVLDSFIYVVGRGKLTAYSQKALLLKLKLNGDLVWIKDYGVSGNSAFVSINELNGSVYLGGFMGVYSNSTTNIVKPWMVKIDTSGSIVDTIFFPEIGQAFNYVKNFVIVNNQFVVNQYARDKKDKHKLLKVDTLGNVKWVRHIEFLPDSMGGELAESIIQTNDGGFAIAGTSFPNVPGYGQDAWLCKVDSFGCMVAGCELAGTEEVTLHYSRTFSYQAWPNPVQAQLHIAWPEGQSFQPMHYRVYNLQGQVVLQQSIAAQSFALEVNTQQLAAGMYVLEFVGQGAVESYRFVKNSLE